MLLVIILETGVGVTYRVRVTPGQNPATDRVRLKAQNAVAADSRPPARVVPNG